MRKESEPPIDNPQDTVELDVEAIFRACDEAASLEAAQTERPVERRVPQPYEIQTVLGSGRQYYRDEKGEIIVTRLDKWS